MVLVVSMTPVMYTDISGEFPILITVATIAFAAWVVHDIYQIGSENVAFKPSKEGGGKISNSSNVQNPLVILGYSVYLKYFSEHTDAFDGSALGISSEWMAHNFAYNATIVPSFISTKVKKINNRAAETDIGRTMFAEDDFIVVVASTSIQATICPVTIFYDLYQHYKRGGTNE